MAWRSSSSGYQLALLDHGVEARAGLDGELVEREVAIGERQGSAQLGFPGCDGLAWPGVDQVERVALEDRGRQLDRGQSLGHGVLAAEEAQVGVVKACTPSETRFTPAARKPRKRAGFDRGRVGLERDLDVGREPPVAGARSITAATVAGAISEGVPPPKKMESSLRPGVSAAKWSSSANSARRHRSWSTSARTWLLKSQ